MNNRPTPETDAFSGKLEDWINFAEKLERERDEAREEINSIRITLSKNGEAVGSVEHDFSIIEMVENLMQSRGYFRRKSDSLERERDEAREQNAKLRDVAERAIELALAYYDGPCERDGAKLRAELEQLKEGGK